MINIQETLCTLGILEINAGSSTGQTSYKSDNIIHSYSPVDGKLIGSVSVTTEKEYEKIIQTASLAFKHWRNIPAPKIIKLYEYKYNNWSDISRYFYLVHFFKCIYLSII